jgi:hypothetical protein
MGTSAQSDHNRERQSAEPIFSRRTRDGSLIETVLKPHDDGARLVLFNGGNATEHRSLDVDGHRFVPYSSRNNLITHRVIVLPSGVAPYGTAADLLAQVQAFIHRYVDLNPDFEEVVAHYVLLTWCHDCFNELPYLRVRGHYGTGKSRFLLTVGALCFKPIFASGASTVSPLFRLLDQIGGTLVIDEADFWASDERAEIVKILNNGNAKGFPVLRSEATPSKEFNPRAFNIFGPKVIATRHAFQDEALESRCLTDVFGPRALRPDVPISLPRAFEDEAETLRNRLLTYRFHQCAAFVDSALDGHPKVEPRRAQIIAPLLKVAVTSEARDRLCEFVGRHRSAEWARHQAERDVLTTARSLLADTSVPLGLSAIARRFSEQHGGTYGSNVSPRWVGSILRSVGLQPTKSNGTYVIPTAEYPRVRELFRQHQIGDIRDNGDAGSLVERAE